MSSFDITKLRTKNSFAASLQKRKALGLQDSDSEDEKPKRKTKKSVEIQSKSTVAQAQPVKETGRQNEPNTPNEEDPKEFQDKVSQTNNYIAVAEALIAQSKIKPTLPKLAPKPKASTPDNKTNISLIELSDEEEDVVVPGAELEDLDPELEAYLKKSTDMNQSQPSKVTMRLQYTHNFLNISDMAKGVVQTLMKPVKILIMDNEQFHKVLDSYCKKKGLNKADVVLTYKEDVVFLSGTPAGLGMNDVGVYNMNVYPVQCYNKMIEEKEKLKLERIKKYNSSDQFEIEVPLPPIQENNDVEKIMLKLRGKDNKDITLRIRPTATLASLLLSYKQFANATGDLKLSFEGEIMDLNQTIEQTDLEDEDLVEVV